MDEKLIEPFKEHFNVTIGRGSFPVRPYIRLMYLKLRYDWGYENFLPYPRVKNLFLTVQRSLNWPPNTGDDLLIN